MAEGPSEHFLFPQDGDTQRAPGRHPPGRVDVKDEACTSPDWKRIAIR
jgi:hypothetical protein